MNRIMRCILPTLLLLAGVCPGTTFVLLAEERPCVQPDYRAVCPISIDPNVVADAVLGPVPHDPNTWTITGQLYRRLETCDPDGDQVLVEIQSSKDGLARIVTTQTGQFLQAAPGRGIYWVFIRITDVPPPELTPISKVILILCYVDGPNRGPVLL